MEYGILVYDVPVTRKRVYGRLRSQIKRCSIPMTWSVYLTPLALRDRILAIMKALDEDEDAADRIMYKYLKFDSSEQAVLDEIVKEEFTKLIKRAKDDLYQRLGELEQQFDDGEISLSDKASIQRGCLSKASKKIKEARRLAALFEVSDLMEVRFQSLEKIVEARRERIKEEVKNERAHDASQAADGAVQ